MHGKKLLYKIIAFSFLINDLVCPSAESLRKTEINTKKKFQIKRKVKSTGQISDLKNQKNEVLARINDVQKKINSEKIVQKNLKDGISKIQYEVDQLNISIYRCKSNLEEQKRRIYDLQELKLKKEEQIKDKKIKLGKCIRLIYMSKIPDAYEVIFGSIGFDDFIDKAHLLKSIMERVFALIDQIINDLQSIQDSIREMEETKLQYEQNLVEYARQEEELTKKMSELDTLYKESQEIQENLKCELDAENDELRSIESEINDYYESLRKKESTTQTYIPKYDGNLPHLLWPVAGFRRITSNFVDTINRKHSHGAIDIGSNRGKDGKLSQSIYGRPVRAPIDMVISYANNGFNGGYGNLVTGTFIHKNDNYCFYFGHLSNIVVKKGQTVKRGSVIGYVGNTGNSTGPHLHFELRKNNRRIDPLIFPFDY